MTEDQIKKLILDHIEEVAKLIQLADMELAFRAVHHDEDKIEPEQLRLHKEFTPIKCAYRSTEYFQNLEKLAPVLERHYQVSRHHPEHFSDIGEMNLIDLLEMICDWIACTKMREDGDIFKSIDINQKRFGYGEELKRILDNTAMFLFLKSRMEEMADASSDS